MGPDHSNEIDLGHLQQIEIVRGPSSLLYANGAVGGIINIVDNTIAKQDIESFKFNVGAGYEDGNNGDTGNASFVGNIGGVNVTSSIEYSDLGNYAIPEHAVIHHEMTMMTMMTMMSTILKRLIILILQKLVIKWFIKSRRLGLCRPFLCGLKLYLWDSISW